MVSGVWHRLVWYMTPTHWKNLLPVSEEFIPIWYRTWRWRDICLLDGEPEKYRVSIKSFPDYKHLLQENYVEYKHIFLPLLKLVSKIWCHVFIVVLQLHVCIPRSFLVIKVCNQGKTLCSPCMSVAVAVMFQNNSEKSRLIHITPTRRSCLPVHSQLVWWRVSWSEDVGWETLSPWLL